MKVKLIIAALSLMAFLAGSAFTQHGVVSVEEVTGLWNTDSVKTNEEIRFLLRVTNNTGEIITGVANGFRVYSPDGAEWATTIDDTTGTIGKAQFDGFFIVDAHSVPTGSGADTCGFGGIAFSAGLPVNFDDTAYTITIGPIESNYHTKTICLDSSLYLPSGVWKWAALGSVDYFPDWDGPHCYTVHDPDAKPSFVADPTEVSWDLDQVQPANVEIEITDTDGGGISFTLAKSQDWLVIDPELEGTTPQTIICSLVVDNLETGETYFDTIWVTSDDAYNSPFAVPCSVHVTASGVELYGGDSRPTSFTLSQNYPNPFNPRTQIRFDLPVRTHVNLVVYNVLGQRVNTLVDEVLSRGQYVVDWDGADQGGSAVSSGIYFYRIEAETFTETRKMVLLK